MATVVLADKISPVFAQFVSGAAQLMPFLTRISPVVLAQFLAQIPLFVTNYGMIAVQFGARRAGLGDTGQG